MFDWIQQLPTQDGAPLLGKVRLLRELGRGGMGVVYGGWHSNLDIPVAVKLLKATLTEGGDAAARFLREARICASIDEPGLVRVFDFDHIEAGSYLVMEYVAGKNLDEVITASGPMTEAEVLTLLRDMSVVLMSLHRSGVIHRDIKPSNLLLRADDGRVKLTDLGIAKMEKSSDSAETKGIMGTPSFMSPEQIRSPNDVSSASDFFSLGATAYYLLTGKRPFDGAGNIFETMQNICNQPLPVEVLQQAGVSQSTIDLLVSLTVKPMSERINDGRQLLGRLPATSVPFRPSILTASRPECPLKRSDTTSFASPNAETISPGSMLSNPVGVTTYQSPQSRSLLICECLQNDFIAPIPSGQPIPNKLHIGREESLRLVGADPAKGPLVRALSACASAEHVRVVHIRDWHDPDDPRQQAELEFFGSHCIMGSHGAKFVDAVEAFSRDRGRSAIVDATGINDFEDTPLADTLEALVDDYSRAEVPVGVIGVWTNVKVHYLLYDLKTRAGFHNLATCSKLVSAPDRVEHRNALRQLETVLGVKVFHEIDEFLAFLGVRPGSGNVATTSETLVGTLING